MTIISIFCFSAFLFFFVSLFKRDTDVFSPTRLFSMIWLLAIGLAELKLSRYQIVWKPYSWLMFATAITSFLLGLFIVYVINFGKEYKAIPIIRYSIRNTVIDKDILFRYTIFLFIAYLVSYIVSTIVIGYLPFFTKFPGLTRNDWGIFGFGLFVQSFPAVIFLSVLYFIAVKGEKLKKFILFLIIFISFITYAFLLQRYYVVFALILIAVTLYYSTNLFKPRNILIILGIAFGVFFGMSFVRLTGTIVNYLYYLSDMKYSVKYAIFTEPYMYIVMNLENFANAVNKIDGNTYGLFTFDWIFALTGIKHSLFEYLGLLEFPNIITNNYNTYTMFFVYYWDYGVIGLGIIPLTLGIVFGTSYFTMRSKPTINSISVYAIFSFVIIFSFFIPIITFLHFAFNFLVIYSITKIATKKTPSLNN